MSEEEGQAAYRENERRSDALFGLAEFAKDAAEAAFAQERRVQERQVEAPEGAWFALSFVVGLLMRSALRLVNLSVRVWTGRGFPRPRAPRGAPRCASGPERLSAAAEPRDRPVRPERPRFADLIALGVPEAEALRARLAALLADPDLAGLVAAEPAVWRAAAPLARALDLPLPPRPEAPVASGAEVPRPAADPATPPARRHAPPPPPPPNEPPLRPSVVRPAFPFGRPAGADPPSASLRSRLLRSAHGWA